MAKNSKLHAPSCRFEALLEKSTNKLWGCHFTVPPDVVARLTKDRSRRVVCSLNRKATYQCAMLPHGGGSHIITVNKNIRNSLGVTFGDSVEVILSADTSDYGLPLPEEFAEAMRQDPAGKKLFHALTTGRQRTLLYIIGKPKLPDKRIIYSLVVLRHLHINKGKINYRQLTMALRHGAIV